MKLHERKEDAASPVIGVMLMLVVTVVIAAVITTFATGMAGDSTATTPMALIEADNQVMRGSILESFDLVHKGGDEMKLENLLVIIEPVGGAQTGIILERKFSAPEESEYYEDERERVLNDYANYQEMMPDMTFTLVETKGDGSFLSVRGKTGRDAVVSTGDRVKVSIKASLEGLELHASGYGVVSSAYKYYTSYDGGSYSDMYSGTTVKWTLSDIRTTGIIAKGEFVVGA